jgi:superfamily II DNA or RNA helicase
MQDATAADDSRPLRRSANFVAVEQPPRAPHLRPYQVEAQNAIVEHRKRGIRTQLVSLATGLGKCVDPLTWVWSGGLRRFADTWGRTRIAGPHQTDEVVGWYDDGINPGKHVTTAAGLTIDGTLAHRIWIRRDDGFEGWCRLADIRAGDHVAIARGQADFGDVEIGPHEAYLLGCGGCDEMPRRAPRSVHAATSGSGATAVLAPNELEDYIEATFGVGWTPAPERTVPDRILRGTRDTVRAYLRGYFTGGADPAAAWTFTSRVCGEQIQQLLIGLGVFCGLRSDTSLDGQQTHTVVVYDVEAFARELGTAASGPAQDRLDVVPGIGGFVTDLIEGIAPGTNDELRRSLEPYAAAGTQPCYSLVRRWIAAVPDSAARRELQRIVDEHRAWTPVVAIADSAIARIDCEVAHSHAFIGNGMVNHNTVIIATLPKLLGLRDGDVTLVVAHRDELIEQIVEKMRIENPGAKIGVEKAERRADDDADIVVATVQTLGDKRLAEFSARFGRRVGLFVIDEAHHAAAPSYRAIVDRILALRSDAMIMGFTATPNRGDGVRLVDVFEKIVYEMDTRKAIDAGYLVPVKSFAVATTTNLDGVASRGGDFVIGALAAAVNTVDRNARIVAAYKQHTAGLKALVFTASVEHARDVAEEFVANDVKAEWASGETPRAERERIVRDFRSGKTNVLVNCGLYLEGFDVPSVQVILNARPTKSTTLYTQITGRALRPVDEIANALSNTDSALTRRELIEKSIKPAAIIIDLVDQAQRHALVTLPSLYGLPPQIDAQGRMTAQIADKFEELLKLDPKRAAKVRSADDIITMLAEVDAFAAPPEIKPTWTAIDPMDHWRMELPAQRVAYDRKGRPIPNFSKLYDQWVTEAKRIAPHEDAESFARRMLNVDPKMIRYERSRIDVKRDGDFYLTLYTTDDLPERVIDKSSSLPGALGSAYTRVDEMLSGYTQIATAPAPNGHSRPRQAGPPLTGAAKPGGLGSAKRSRNGRGNRRPKT